MQNITSLIHCRTIGGSNIKRDDKSRIFMIDDVIIRLTPTEYRILRLLLENQLVDDTTLVNEAMQYPEVTRIDKQISKTLERHIDNIKSKLGHLPLAIRRVQRYGYALVSS